MYVRIVCSNIKFNRVHSSHPNPLRYINDRPLLVERNTLSAHKKYHFNGSEDIIITQLNVWWRQQQKPSQTLSPSSIRKLPSAGSDEKFFCSTATRAKQIKKCTNFYFNLFKFGARVASVCLASMYSAERWKLNWKTKNIIMKYNVRSTATLPKNPLRVQRGGLLVRGMASLVYNFRFYVREPKKRLLRIHNNGSSRATEWIRGKRDAGTEVADCEARNGSLI